MTSRPRKYRPITDEDKIVTLKMFREGASDFAIGIALGRTKRAVRALRGLLNLRYGSCGRIRDNESEVRDNQTRDEIAQASAWHLHDLEREHKGRKYPAHKIGSERYHHYPRLTVDMSRSPVGSPARQCAE